MQALMESQYDFKAEYDGTSAVDIIKIKSNDSHPYSVKKMKDDLFRLSHQYQQRTYMAPKWQKIKDFPTRDEALAYIIRQHNKSCKHMVNWTRIEV